MTDQLLTAPTAPTQIVLIVDDNANNLATLSDYLIESDFEVLIARSGEQALERARATHPALILLDIVMPGMDGFEVCRQLKADAATRDILIIFMTALGETEHKVTAFQLGAVDYITKPLQREEVLARVLTHLRLSALTEALEQTVQERTAALTQANRRLQQEIAERERAEAALRESETKYRYLVEHANDGIAIVQDGILQYCNRALAELHGYAVEEMLGRPISDFIAPDALPQVREKQRRRAAGEPVPQIYEATILHKDGRALSVEFNAGQTIYQGRPADQVLIRDITARKQMEAALQQRIIALTRPLDDAQGIAFTDLFDLAEIQEIQDAFAAATGVASIITHPDGTPLTRPSNFCRLCNDIIRKTEKGLANCMYSDAVIGRYNPNGPIMQPCLSGGLWDGGASITVGERHIANWLIGQVRNSALDEAQILAYAREIGADEEAFRVALGEVAEMSVEQFANATRVLFLLANLMSRIAYQNIQQARFIAEREQTATALRASEERFRRLAENAKDMIYRMALPEGRYEYASPAALEITGYSPEEFYQSPRLVQDIMPPVWQAYFQEQFANLLKGDIPPYYEYQIIHKSGELRWLNQRNVLIRDANGVPIAIEGIVTDVSDRKSAEEERLRLLAQIQEQAQRMQQIIAIVPEGVLLLDTDRRVVLANPMAERDLRALAESQQAGDPLTHLGDQDLTALLTSPPKGLWHELTVGNRVFQVLARATETGPAPGGWVLVIRDMTQQRDQDRRIQQQERLAAVGQLAAGIAHDFNNVMASIVLYAQMTARAPDISDRIRERMHTINQQAQHATNLIRQILDFSRRAIVERRPMDLLPFLNEQVKLFKRTLPENIAITFWHDANEYLVSADPTSMQQMLMNLVVNARDAMPEGGELQIRLAHFRSDEHHPAPLPALAAGEWVQLCVADTGSGIPPDVQEHMFEPFFTTKAPGQGAGLGLAQVHGIVGLHEGQITVDSEIGRGATFTVYLPALNATSPEVAPEVERYLPKGHGATILVVEDNSTAREALRESLELLDYRTLEAANGREALLILAERQAEIALVLSDVVMPELGGIALLHALQERGMRQPVLLLTGHPLESELETLQGNKSPTSPVDWMLKPPALERLAEKIAELLRPRTP